MLDLFFPRCCSICGQILTDDGVICHDCISSLPRTEQSFQRGNITEEMFAKEPKFGRGAVFMFFERDSPIHRALHKMKYGRFADPHIAYALAREAANEFMQSDFFDGIDIIMPVPLHPRRLGERGFNQSEWICKALTDATGIPTDATHLLRVKNNRHQARLNKSERQENVQQIFRIIYPEDLYHKHILLVDDIITSGATLRACMDALKGVRGRKVSVFGLGKVR